MHPYKMWLAQEIADKALRILRQELSRYRNKRKVRFIHMKKRVRNERRHEGAAMAAVAPCPLVGAYDRTIPVDADGVADLHGDAEAQYYEEGL